MIKCPLSMDGGQKNLTESTLTKVDVIGRNGWQHYSRRSPEKTACQIQIDAR